MLKAFYRKIALPLCAAMLFFALSACRAEDEGQFFLNRYFTMKFYGTNFITEWLCKREITAFLKDFEKKASSHIKDSEVSRFNRAKAGERVELSEHVYKLFELSIDYYKKSGFAFNPCLYDLIKLWRFMESDDFFGVEELPSQQQIEQLLHYAAPSLIELSEGAALKLHDEVRVDFGAIAKGYALDVCAQIAEKHGIRSALFNLAGNIYAMGLKDGGEKFSVGITDPRMTETGEQYFSGVLVSETSVSVSGDYERYFLKDGVRYCHIIDPFTGWPVNTGSSVSGIISAVVFSPSAALADAFSTAVMVSGPEGGKSLLEQNGLEGIIITADKKYCVVGDIELYGVNEHYERGQWQTSLGQ